MNQTYDIRPPHWPLRILRFFLKDEFQEEIEGDLEELFLENTKRFSARKAKKIYVLETLKLLRPGLMKNLKPVRHPNQYAMVKKLF